MPLPVQLGGAVRGQFRGERLVNAGVQVRSLTGVPGVQDLPTAVHPGDEVTPVVWHDRT